MKRRGFALMLVILEMVLIAALWGVAHRQLAATMRFVAYQQAQSRTNLPQGVEVHKQLAYALSLLETGDPPDQGSGVYTGHLTILTDSGPAYFLVTFLKQPAGSNPSGSPGDVTWAVTAIQATVDSSGLDDWNKYLLPTTFSSSN